MTDYRNRIKALEYVDANELVAHPGNWRSHPAAQAQALKGVLNEVGIAGALLAGSAAWFWGVVRPWLPGSAGTGQSAVLSTPSASFPVEVRPAHSAPVPAAEMPTPPPRTAAVPVAPPPRAPGYKDGYAAAGYDRQMLYEEIRLRFSRDDLQDLMFDLDVNELDVVVAGQTNDELIVRIMDAADDGGQTGAVALAVERILTPPPPEYLPRPEKLSVESPRTVIRHILPNAIGPIIVESTLEVGYAIMEEAGLSFLGFGIQPPTPSWGNLLSTAPEHMLKHPWLAIFPGLMIFVTIISVNYIGDGLRDAFDPFKVLQKIGEV